MIYKFIQFIMLLLPFGLVVHLNKYNKALPANIRTRTGGVLKAIMVTDKYGILFKDKDYIKNRVKFLRNEQDKLNQAYDSIAKEMNSLSAQAREYFFEDNNADDINR